MQHILFPYMVNKKIISADKPLSALVSLKVILSVFIGVLLFLCLPDLKAQKASKDYNYLNQENGSILYFIYPCKDFKGTIPGSKFEYDLTYLNSGDSVTLNFLYKGKFFFSIDSISLISSQEVLTSPANKIYVDSSKSDWIYRYGSRFSFEDLYQFFSEQTPPQMKIHGEGVPPISVTIKEKDWKKRSELNLRIFDLIQINKK